MPVSRELRTAIFIYIYRGVVDANCYSTEL